MRVNCISSGYMYRFESVYFNLQKLNVFLFDKVLVLSRPSQRTGEQRFQIHRTPIPVNELLLETEGDGKHGSFRSGLAHTAQSCKCFFFQLVNVIVQDALRI